MVFGVLRKYQPDVVARAVVTAIVAAGSVLFLLTLLSLFLGLPLLPWGTLPPE